MSEHPPSSDHANAVLDTLGMVDAARRVVASTESAMLAVQDAAVALPDDLGAVVLAGTGAGRWAADVVAAIAAPIASVPVVVSSQSTLPAFVDSSTLLVDIHSDGAPSLTVGGDRIPLGITVPHLRAAVGAVCAAVLVVLERTGTVGDISSDLDHAVAQLHHRSAQLVSADGLASKSDAARVARRIGRLFPLVYGAGDIGRLAALRWKQQINVNAKAPAYAGSLPDLFHDEIAGFGQHGDVTRQVMCAVLLRHDHEGDTEGRFAELDDVLVESVAAVHEVRAAGTGRLAQLLDLAYVGDVVSLHLALNEGLDPGPAPFLTA